MCVCVWGGGVCVSRGIGRLCVCVRGVAWVGGRVCLSVYVRVLVMMVWE